MALEPLFHLFDIHKFRLGASRLEGPARPLIYLAASFFQQVKRLKTPPHHAKGRLIRKQRKSSPASQTLEGCQQNVITFSATFCGWQVPLQ